MFYRESVFPIHYFQVESSILCLSFFDFGDVTLKYDFFYFPRLRGCGQPFDYPAMPRSNARSKIPIAI